MALWQAMAKAFDKDTTLHDVSAEQGEAIIDALVLVLYSDGKASFLETTELEHLLHEMPWTHSNSALVDAYTEASAERAKGVHTNEDIEAFVNGVASRLPEDAGIREKTYELASRLAHADWQIHPGERNVLDGLAKGLGIESGRAAELDKKVADATL